MADKLVLWSSKAEGDFDEQINYLIQNWSVESADRFIDEVLGIVDSISRHPFQYPAWEGNQHIRRCVVNQHILLFYQIRNEEIVLLTFFPTRQNPEDLDLSG